MRPITDKRLRRLIIAMAASAMCSGCLIDRSPIISWATLQPQQYCAGDMLGASYDFLREETCPADASCATHHPNLVITSTPTAFPERRVTAFNDSFTFVPSGDSVSVVFDIDRDAVLVPTARFEDGRRIFVQRTDVRDATLTASRITGAFTQDLTHGGMCTGSGPQWALADLPGPPRFSANLRLARVINTSGVLATISVVDDTGAVASQVVRPGDGFTPDMPGTPPRTWRTVGIMPMSSSIVCGSGTATPFPPVPPLTTSVQLGCP